MLIHNNQQLYNYVQKLIKKNKASNYSTYFDYYGETYIYQSEVDPHAHRGE